jgi:hypothetical protein
MSIITVSHFQKSNELYIPLSVAVPTSNSSNATPNNNAYLVELIAKTEKQVLINALGLATYNTLQLAISDDFVNPIYASYEKLVKGEEYDGKIWNGLEYDYSLLAYKVFEDFVTETNKRLSAVGTVEVNPQGANLSTPAYKIASANNAFILQYQDGYLNEPIISDDGMFIDWFGQTDGVFVSLYRYLIDKKADFVDWSEEKFRPSNDIKNSFGI